MATPAVSKTVTVEMDTTQTPAEAGLIRPDINKSIQDEVAKKIKSRFMAVDTVSGTAQMFDTQNYHSGVDYTAGGQLVPRWVAANEANIIAKRMKGYFKPSEISSQFKDITMGNMTLMVRESGKDREHQAEVETLNRNWESKVNSQTKPNQGTGLGEFEVTKQKAIRG